MNAATLVQKRWNDCKALHDDGMSYGEYTGPLNDLRSECAYEWGVCEGLRDDVERDRYANAWLNCVSLSDSLNPAPITMEDIRLSCAGLGLAFGKLAQSSPDCPFARGRRAATWLGRMSNPDSRAIHYFDKHDHDADVIRTPTPQNLAEAIDWLQNGANAAGQGLSSAWLTGLPKPGKLSFEQLRSILSPNQEKQGA